MSHRFILLIPPDDWQALRARKSESGVAIAEIIRRAIRKDNRRAGRKSQRRAG